MTNFKKMICTLVVLIMFSAGSVAQDLNEERKGYFKFSAGPALPVGDFGSTDQNVGDAGYAEIGFQGSILDFGYRIHKKAGVTLSYTYGNYSTSLYENNMAGSWKYNGLFIGPLLSHTTENGNYTVDLTQSLGYMFMNFSGEGIVNEIDEAGIGYKAGLALNYNITNGFSLVSGVDYIRSNAEFTTNGETSSQSVSSINLSFGLILRF